MGLNISLASSLFIANSVHVYFHTYLSMYHAYKSERMNKIT